MAIHQYFARQSFLGQEIGNVFYYDHAVNDPDVRQAIANAIRLAWATRLQAFLDTSWSLLNCIVRQVDVAEAPGIVVPFSLGALVGTAAGLQMPTQIALLVKSTGLTFPPNKTRTYLAGWQANALTEATGLWASNVVSAANSFGLDLLTITVDLEPHPRKAVRYTGTPPVVTASNTVTSVSVATVPATQRRRRIGSGS